MVRVIVAESKQQASSFGDVEQIVVCWLGTFDFSVSASGLRGKWRTNINIKHGGDSRCPSASERFFARSILHTGMYTVHGHPVFQCHATSAIPGIVDKSPSACLRQRKLFEKIVQRGNAAVYTQECTACVASLYYQVVSVTKLIHYETCGRGCSLLS